MASRRSRAFGGARPDIVLASIATPKRSGYDVAAFVKSEPGLASIPVLLLAGAFEPVDQVRAAQVRCDGVLVKPLEPRQVVARVKELIAGATGTLGIAASAAPGPVEHLIWPPSSSDDYFDHLDAAFAQRSAPGRPLAQSDSGVVPTLDSVLKAAPANPPAGPVDSRCDGGRSHASRRRSASARRQCGRPWPTSSPRSPNGSSARRSPGSAASTMSVNV